MTCGRGLEWLFDMGVTLGGVWEWFIVSNVSALFQNAVQILLHFNQQQSAF